MATVQEILDNIKASTSNNINNNSFIELMQQKFHSTLVQQPTSTT